MFYKVRAGLKARIVLGTTIYFQEKKKSFSSLLLFHNSFLSHIDFDYDQISATFIDLSLFVPHSKRSETTTN